MSFISYAQNLEDVMLYRALRDVKRGFYVDVGANSPNQHSVTRALYERGWRGINIEPVPAFHEQLVAARPDDINLAIAVGDRAGLINFYDVPDTGLSTVDPEVARQHRLSGYPIIERQVPVETLDQVFATQGVDLVHFLKIDVEGHESAVLRGLSLRDVRPWIIVVEATAPLSQDQNHSNWDKLLMGQGYGFVYFDGLNRYYLADEKAGLTERFASPPNIFDDWIRVHDWRAHELVGNLSRRITGEQEALQAERAVRQREAEARQAEAAVRRTEAEIRHAEAAARQTEAEIRHGEVSVRETELKLRQAELARQEADAAAWKAAWSSEIEARSAEWARITGENTALRGRIAELEAIAASLDTYIREVRRSSSWRVTAPLRGLSRMSAAIVRMILFQGGPRPGFGRFVRRTLRWAAEKPAVRKALLPVMLRHPALADKARALLARERLVPPAPTADQHPPAPHVAASAAHPIAPAPLGARSLTPAERTIEAAIRRAQARAR
jgi:FkbM family methyltransferase